MSETRPINIYKNGVLIGVDGYIEVSDEELEREADEKSLKKYMADPHSGLPSLEVAFQALVRILGK